MRKPCAATRQNLRLSANLPEMRDEMNLPEFDPAPCGHHGRALRGRLRRSRSGAVRITIAGSIGAASYLSRLADVVSQFVADAGERTFRIGVRLGHDAEALHQE